MMLDIIFLFIIIISIRIIYMYKFEQKTRNLHSAKTLIVIGSGGHTLEMLNLVKKLDPKLFIPRLYVMANEDASSEYKITQVEKEFAVTKSNDYEIYKIPRSRHVNQSYLTSLFTTTFSLIKSIPIVIRFKPQLILCNGPGTCVPICLIAFLTNIFLFFKTKIVFIESICRVKTLSLSGKILMFVADVIIVQWSSLHQNLRVKNMPLKGIKVLELAGLAPAPFCGAILADFGASVTRIDKVSSHSFGDCFTNGKKSLALNLKDEKGKKIFLKLASGADVLIEPFRQGVMENLGLGPDFLTKLCPKLIYARLTGYGQNGPYCKMAGHDINFLSLSGVLSFLGRKYDKPTPPVNVIADFGGGGLMCAFGIILALFERTKSGKGQILDCSMVEGAAYLGSWLFRSQNLPIWGRKRGENILDTGAHFYETYETKDGKFVAVGALESQFYNILIEKLKAKELENQWTDFNKKKKILSDIFKDKTRDEWCKIFHETDACVTPVLEVGEVANHPHNKERDSFLILNENIIVPKPAPKLSRTQGFSKAVLPQVENGAHTYEILKELGYLKNEIEDLIENKIVGIAKSSKL